MHVVNLRSRRGIEFGVLVVLMLPLIVVLFSVGLDGMAFAATVRRAQGVAAVAAQAGATRIDFYGAKPSLSADACATAVANARANTQASFGALATCAVSAGSVRVTVGMNVPKLFGFYSAIPGRVQMTVAAQPEFGITVRE